MRFEIGFTVNGIEDTIIVDGDTVEDVREKAMKEVDARGGIDPWSREIDHD